MFFMFDSMNQMSKSYFLTAIAILIHRESISSALPFGTFSILFKTIRKTIKPSIFTSMIPLIRRDS